MNNYSKLKGKKFIAQKGIEVHNVLYDFKSGGGIKGRTIKAGDILVIGGYDSAYNAFYVNGILHKMKVDFFADPEYTIQIN